MAITPYKNSSKNKKKQVAEMFDNISPKYDLLNHLLSLNIDKYWRKKAIKEARKYAPSSILDIATGTADFAIAASKINGAKITGIDISEGMLAVGRVKVKKKKLDGFIELKYADSENLPFQNDIYDLAMAGFGVRNFETIGTGLKEVYRVLKKDGAFIVLEFSKPRRSFFKPLFYFYFKVVLPFIGKIISRDNSAYTYLPDSVDVFPSGSAFLEIMEEAGFKNTRMIPLTFGVATIYIGEKLKSSNK